MKILESSIYEGRNIYSHKKCIKVIVDLEGYCEIPSKDIEGFNEKLIKAIPELYKHRCGIDEEFGFIKRLNEGTYLAHICEHIIIAIQNTIGIDIAYGKSREIKDDIYYIIFQYEYSKTAIEILNLAIDIINLLIDNKEIKIEDKLEKIREIYREELIGPSTSEICTAAKDIGLPIIKIGNGEMYQIGYGKQGRIIEGSICNDTKCVSVDISCNKTLTKEILKIHNLPVAAGYKVNDRKLLLEYSKDIDYPVVLKPENGNKAKGIILNIKNDKELIDAFDRDIKNYKDLIIEKYYEGNDYRVCVINYEVVAVAQKIAPYVIGDGIKDIEILISDINKSEFRGEDHENRLTKIIINDDLINFIGKKGYKLKSILKRGEKLVLRENSNISNGGTSIDCTDIICEENKEICIRAAKAIGLDICGIDIRSKSIEKPLYDNGVILEINASPGLRMHIYPQEGKKRLIGKAIINMMYNNNPINIPIIAITGTNGKTTTTRLINSTLNRMGYNTGMTSTEGIYLNSNCIDIGDDTGVESARCILFNKEVEIAILETARGGIIRKGLAYDLADVAVITNITEDHLGCNDIYTMEELCHVKSLVAEAVKDNGYVIINADDYWSKTIIPRIKANIIYFSKEKENELILENINKKEIAIYLKDNYIVVNNRGKEYSVIAIENIPIALNGALEFNIENAMASCAALVALEIDYAMIKIGLSMYELNSSENNGRFNIYDYNGVRIVLDYGHNIDGYIKTLNALKIITKGKCIGVIGIPGDRENRVANEIGRIAAQKLDKIIIKEDTDRRGREKGEMANLLLNAVLKENKNIDVKVIINEVEALKEALKVSKKNDTIIVFYENIEPLREIIIKKNNS